MAAALVFSCTEKPELPDSEGNTEPEETPVTPPQPEPEPEPEIKPMFDIKFQPNGTAVDISENNYHINTYDGPSFLTWEHPSYDDRMARFTHTTGSSISDSYCKFNYSSDTKFKNKLSDGYSLEAIIMLDADNDGANEIKAFCSTEQGGTGIMISSLAQGKEITFLTNVSTNGSSNWVWGRSGIIPERGRYYHVIGVWDKDKNEARVYVDGVLRKTVKTNGTFNFPKTPAFHWFGVGADPAATGAQSAWKGDVAMARIYNEAVTTEWVQKHWQSLELNLPKATFLPENAMYMTTCNVKAGGTLTVAGKGFESSDHLEILSIDETFRKECSCEVLEKRLIANMPDDITDGRYKLILKRGNESYPLGIITLQVTDQANELKAPKIIAHRGYHKGGIPENSIQALTKAQEYGFYGSEVDVWITTDQVLVCNHDGVLSNMKLQDCTYDQVKNLKLSNGESLPTFEATLDQLAKCEKTRLVLEFKTHSTTERNIAVVDKAMEMIESKGLKHMIDYIAFDYEICKRIVAEYPDATVGYLNGDKDPSKVYADGINCIDYSFSVMNTKLSWIQQAHDLGMEVNVWTVNSDNDMMLWMSRGVDYITTDNPDRLQEIINAFCL